MFPLFSGSALRNERGTPPGFPFPLRSPSHPFPRFRCPGLQGRPGSPGARLAFLRVTGGTLKARDLLSLKTPEGETLWAEKAAEIRLYSGARYAAVQEVPAGQVCCVVGLSKALPGDGLGSDPGRREQTLRPCYACRLVTTPAPISIMS